MITRALIGHGPTGAPRRAAYEEVLGTKRVQWLTGDPDLAEDVVVDLDDPEALPSGLRNNLLASKAFIVTGAPLLGAPRPRTFTAWSDLLSGAVTAMAEDLTALGRRTMTKAIVANVAPGVGPPAWKAALALTALGGGLKRIAARRQPQGAGFDAIYGVGRFRDGSIAYIEAVAGAPPGAELCFYEAVGRGGLREYDSRLDVNRVICRGVATPLPATRTHPYTELVAGLVRAEHPGLPAGLDSVLADARAAYSALVRACDSGAAEAP